MWINPEVTFYTWSQTYVHILHILMCIYHVFSCIHGLAVNLVVVNAFIHDSISSVMDGPPRGPRRGPGGPAGQTGRATRRRHAMAQAALVTGGRSGIGLETVAAARGGSCAMREAPGRAREPRRDA